MSRCSARVSMELFIKQGQPGGVRRRWGSTQGRYAESCPCPHPTSHPPVCPGHFLVPFPCSPSPSPLSPLCPYRSLPAQPLFCPLLGAFPLKLAPRFLARLQQGKGREVPPLTLGEGSWGFPCAVSPAQSHSPPWTVTLSNEHHTWKRGDEGVSSGQQLDFSEDIPGQGGELSTPTLVWLLSAGWWGSLGPGQMERGRSSDPTVSPLGGRKF